MNRVIITHAPPGEEHRIGQRAELLMPRNREEIPCLQFESDKPGHLLFATGYRFEEEEL